MKLSNEYQRCISGGLYEQTPKAVYAALAVSFLTMRDDGKDWDIDAELLNEWRALHQAGIVPQKPPVQP